MRKVIRAFALTILAASIAAVGAEVMAGAHSSESKGTVLVAGASGKTGRFVMEQLKAQGYSPRGMTRNIERAKENVPGDYEWVEGDVTDPATLSAAMDGADYVISTIGSQEPKGPNSPEFVDYGGVKSLVDAAVAAEVKHFVLMSSQGATNDDPEYALNKMFNMVLVWKLKGEDHLRASGLNYTVARPGGLEGARYEPGSLGLKFDQGDDGSGIVHRADVATVMIAALSDADANKKTFELFSDKEAEAGNWDGAFAALAADE